MAPPELLARAILSGCAHGFLDNLTQQLRPLRVAPAALSPLLPRLRDHVRARIAALAQARALPRERHVVKISVHASYLALAAELERLGRR